jgi:hypothetical protein
MLGSPFLIGFGNRSRVHDSLQTLECCTAPFGAEAIGLRNTSRLEHYDDIPKRWATTAFRLAHCLRLVYLQDAVLSEARLTAISWVAGLLDETINIILAVHFVHQLDWDMESFDSWARTKAVTPYRPEGRLKES